MSDTYDDPAPPFPAMPVGQAENEPASESTPGTEETPDDPVVKRFASCRWHEKQDNGTEYCAHRDVLPYAGRNGFKPESWCVDCEYYKLRRKVRKREDYQ